MDIYFRGLYVPLLGFEIKRQWKGRGKAGRKKWREAGKKGGKGKEKSRRETEER